MPLKERFSLNLRKLCEHEKSYAHVARQLGINRQQLNDYLTGNSLPNEGIVKNICTYFQIDVSKLFESNTRDIFSILENLQRSNRATVVRDGCYYCDFLMQKSGKSVYPDGILRSLLKIGTINGLTHFRRLTHVEDFYFATQKKPIGNHLGLVTQVDDDTVFFGLNRAPPYEPSILVAKPAFSPSIAFVGTAFTMGENYVQSAFALTYVTEELPLRTLLKNIGYMKVSQNRKIKELIDEVRRIRID